MGSASTAQPVAGACVGDCDGDGSITVQELVTQVGIALGEHALEQCPAVDHDGNGVVSIAELQTAVSSALEGCPDGHTPTPTAAGMFTATPKRYRTPTRTQTTPTSTPSPPEPGCGNGLIEETEECDDGNLVDHDGCSATCELEPGGDVCAGVPIFTGTQLSTVLVASGLSMPLYVTAPPRDVSRIFIVEQSGRIRIVKHGKLLSTPFLNLAGQVISGGERGLLSLAFHPDYAANGEFFVDYTTPRGEQLVSVVSRFHVSVDPDQADPESEEIILEQVQPFRAHNGGQLLFDSDGLLYISFGDGGISATMQNNAQDPTTWLGKILRIDLDGGTPYAIPAANPFVGPDGVLDEIWALGLRNPWRFSIDEATGIAYIGDVGEGSREEVNVQPPDSRGPNYGWCCREGAEPFAGRCFEADRTCPAGGFTPPAIEYSHQVGCSVTGGFVYRGCSMPNLHGTYFYGDYCTAFIRSFVYLDGAVEDERDWTAQLAPPAGRTIDLIAGFGEDARGEIYICDLGGEVFKIVPGS